MNSLAAIITECQKSIDAHSHHDLSLGRRREVWRCFGPRDNTDLQAEFSLAHRIRYKLARITIEKAFDVCQPHESLRRLVQQAIDIADDAHVGSISRAQAWKRHGEIWTACDDLAYDSLSVSPIVCAGYGAAQLIAVALRDEDFPDDLDLGVTDTDVDPEDFDCSFCAAAALANGPIWSDQSIAEKRREFWTWWLESANQLALESSDERPK
jgi:hypothetical protein